MSNSSVTQTAMGGGGGEGGGGGGGQGGIGQNHTNVFLNESTTISPNYYHDEEYAMPEMPQWIPVSYLILLCVAIGVGIPGNLVTALAYFCVKVKTNCDWYIFFVAVFDLISCTFRVTGYLLEFLGVWAQLTSTCYCLFVSWISQTSVGMSIFIVGLIAIDRCIKVSFKSRLSISPTQSRNICLIFTALAFALGSPTLLIYGNTPRGICIVTRESSAKAWVRYYYSTIFLLLFAMMAAVIFCYLNIAWTVMKNRRVIHIVPTYSTNQGASTSRYTRNPQQEQQHQSGQRLIDPGGQRERVNNDDRYPHHHHQHGLTTLCVPSSSHRPCRGRNKVRNSYNDDVIEGDTSNSNNLREIDQPGRSFPMDTLPIPQVPRLFVIPGPQTRAIVLPRLPQNSRTTTNKTNTNSITSTTSRTTTKTTTTTAHDNNIHAIDVVDHTELNLEKATEMNKRNSDESVRSRIRFSKDQWKKRLARDYKVTGLLFLVTTMFIISWIAPIYATFRAFFVGITFPFTVEDAVILIYAPNLYIINNFVNPIIYLALSATYRRKVKHFFERCMLCLSRLMNE